MSLLKRKKTRRTGGIYRRSDWIIIHPINKATSGIGIASPPVFRVSVGASQEEIGQAIVAALAAFTSEVPHPSNWTNHGKEFLKAAGFRSWRALEKDAVYCNFSDDGDTFRFQPLRYGGTHGDKKGFQPFEASEVVVSSAVSVAEIGEAALEALRRAC